MSPEPCLVMPAEVDAEAVLARIRRWVEIESSSDNPAGILRLLDAVEEEFSNLPVAIERVAGRDGHGEHMVLRYDPADRGGTTALVMGHVDTVWPVGTIERRPLSVDGDRMYGPGIYDMKSGTSLGVHAIRYMAETGLVPPRPVTMLLNSDEEIGSPTSRALIEALARDAAFVLVPEPAVGPDIAAVTSRKGWARFKLTAYGRPAHAGGNHAEGRSAIKEIARQILALEDMTDYQSGITVNVGVVHGGTLLNVVPAEAHIEIDLRVTSDENADRLVGEILSRQAFDPDILVTVEGGMNRPPFMRSAAVATLYEAARGLSEKLGFKLPETMRGGVSDGNFTAALGKPTLDGLGCGGHGAHAEDEHILLSTVRKRAALMLNMLVSSDFQRAALGGAA